MTPLRRSKAVLRFAAVSAVLRAAPCGAQTPPTATVPDDTHELEPTKPAPSPTPAPGRPEVKNTPPPVPAGAARVSAPVLRYDLRVDVPAVVLGYVAWSTLQALNTELAPASCRVCDTHLNAVDRGARDALRWSSSNLHIAVTVSDITANALAPAASVGLSAILAARDNRFDSVPIDIIVIAEAVTLAGVATQITKYSVGRMRPNIRGLPEDEHPEYGHGHDAYVSFYSGHTSYAFSLATAAGTVASLRHYRGAEWVWIAGLSVAATTGYLRIAADQHYLTDVLASAAAASAIGAGVPLLFHAPTRYLVPLTPSAQPIAGGAIVSVSGLL